MAAAAAANARCCAGAQCWVLGFQFWKGWNHLLALDFQVFQLL